jgi:hypothetical protein
VRRIQRRARPLVTKDFSDKEPLLVWSGSFIHIILLFFMDPLSAHAPDYQSELEKE